MKSFFYSLRLTMNNKITGIILLCVLNILILPDYITAVIAEEDVELNSEPTSEIDEFIDESANGGKENPNTCMKNKPFVLSTPSNKTDCLFQRGGRPITYALIW